MSQYGANGNALRVDPTVPGALLRAVQSGIILAKIINHVTQGLGLDERALNAGETDGGGGIGSGGEIENHRLVINAAKAAGCNLDGTLVTAEALAKGDPHATIDIVWQLLRCVTFFGSRISLDARHVRGFYVAS